MIKSVHELFRLLSTHQRSYFLKRQLLVILMAFLEIIGIASIVPFMALVGDNSLIEGDGVLAQLYKLSESNNHRNFNFLLGVGVLSTLSLSSLVSMITISRLSLFATKTGNEIANTLYSYYMRQDWLFHATRSSAQLTKQIANEAQRTTGQILLPLMQINSRLVLSSGISIVLFIYNPIVAIVAIGVFFLHI